MHEPAELSLCRPDPHSLDLVVGVLVGPQQAPLKAAPCVPDHLESQGGWGVMGTGRRRRTSTSDCLFLSLAAQGLLLLLLETPIAR